ncbi:lamin tail domain-containing protein [Echinicola jeungdonensis]|uniref:Lamin tail domain-containing protein n=1 Tax=Echinicola jeungdonensis TaxID=709343 RepID=A0ABV5J721_9BACT|nr:lamin tail domain-containing protein [Echinicola jeungdonensis]MDN3668727.1 lamin tail domain-containing protein [Echinicola jeungdonensis]
MKTSHLTQFLTLFFLSNLFLPYLLSAQSSIQDFDTEFNYVDHPDPFLPNWSGNEIHEGSRRIFQALGEGLEGSHALGIQTIGSFNAEIYIKSSTKSAENPKISFFAKTKQNGSGNRPVSVYYSCSFDGGNNFSQPVQIGNDQTFTNQDSPFKLYEEDLPKAFADKDQITIKLEVIYGEGSGTSARLLIDNFTPPFTDQEPPLSIDTAFLQSPYKLNFQTTKALKEIQVSQVSLSNHNLIMLQKESKDSWVLKTENPMKSHPIHLTLNNLGQEGKTIDYTIKNDHVFLGQYYFLDAQTIHLGFTQILDPTSASHTDIFEINGEQPEDIILADNEFSLSLHLSEPISLNSKADVEIQKIVSQSGFESKTQELEALYTDHIQFLEVAQQDKIILDHDRPLNPNIIHSLSFKITDENFVLNPDFDPEKPERLTLRVNPGLKENIIYQLDVPLRLDQDGQIMAGSNRSFSLDLSPPKINEVNVINQQKIEINFSEPVDSIMAIIPEHYSINGKPPAEINWGKEKHQVFLKPKEKLISGKGYNLIVNGVEDLARNPIQDEEFFFQYTGPNSLDFKAIVINEIMPAPKKENPLPYAEYIEILNPGEDTLDLVGLHLANSKTEVSIPNYKLPPQGYLILANQDDKSAFEPHGPTVGLTSWPRFVNSGDQVKLLQNKVCLDSLAYSEASFGSSSLADDGISLEVVNPYSPCNQSLKLRPSTDPKLGTPGRKNSVFDDTPDLVGPKLLGITVMDSTHLRLDFDETLQPDLTSSNWTISPALEVIQADFVPTSLTKLVIKVDQLLKEKTLYSLEVKNIRDCQGNSIQPQFAQGNFQVPSLASKGDILLNEILFHPQSGTPKFVEVYNHSSKFIDLNNWKLANIKEKKISDREFISTNSLIIEPHSYLVFTESPEELIQVYPKAKKENLIEIPDLPSYPISGGTVILLNPEENIEERMNYNEDLHHELLKDPQGVSLERISPDQEANEPENWHSAAASIGFATPGFKNSHYYPNENKESIVQVSPKIFTPNDPINPPFTTFRYQLPKSGFLANMRIFNTGGHLIKKICQNDILGQSGIYTWDGTNLKGQKVRPGYYILWAEIINLNGEILPIKKTIIVGGKL